MEIPKFCLSNEQYGTYRALDQAGDAFLQGGPTVYCVKEAVVRDRGLLATAIFDKARMVFSNDAGRTVSKAIRILNLDSIALGSYLELISVQNEREQADFQQRETFISLSGILKASVILFDPVARRYALSRLDSRQDFTEMRRLTISIDYRIEAWFESAATAAVWKALENWSSLDYGALSAISLEKVIKLKMELLKARVCLLFTAPIAPTCNSCQQGSLCRRKWELFWEEWGIPIVQTFYDQPTPIHEREGLIETMEEQRTICEACFEGNKAAVAKAFAQEDAIISAFVSEWRASLRFHSVEAAVEAIKRRSEVYQGVAGYEPGHDLAYLSLTSGGLGSLLD